MKEETDKLRTTMLEYATAFLNDAAEFYPFGGVVGINGDITPLAAYTGNNYPKSAELLVLLETGIADKFSKHEIKYAAIVSDTDFRETKISDLVQAIKIKLMTSYNAYDEHYYLYKINLGKVEIYQYIIYTGKVLVGKTHNN